AVSARTPPGADRGWASVAVVLEEHGGDVALTEVRHDHDDVLVGVLRTGRHLEGRPHVGARGDTGENALLLAEPLGGGQRVLESAYPRRDAPWRAAQTLGHEEIPARKASPVPSRLVVASGSARPAGMAAS